MEERHSLIDHPNSFKTQGLKEFADDVQNYIDKSIMRNGSELDTLKQIEAQLIMRNYQGFMKKGKLKGRVK